MEVGLPYIRIGQSAATLSDGEARRVKLPRELLRRDTGNTLYILDESTTVLHFDNIDQLLQVPHSLGDRGNAVIVIVIEHKLDLVKTADWASTSGRRAAMAAGTPGQVSGVKASQTAGFMRALLG